MVIAAAQDASRTKIYENNAVSVKFTENYKVEIICIVGIACYIVWPSLTHFISDPTRPVDQPDSYLTLCLIYRTPLHSTYAV